MKFPLIALPFLLLIGCSSNSTQSTLVPAPQFTPYPGLTSAQERQETERRMKLLGLTIQKYMKRHENKTPDISSPDAMRNALYSYAVLILMKFSSIQ